MYLIVHIVNGVSGNYGIMWFWVFCYKLIYNIIIIWEFLSGNEGVWLYDSKI